MEYVSAGPRVLLLASAWLIGWVFSLYGAGDRVIGGVVDRSREGGFWLHAVFSMAVGLLFLSLWVFLCGVAGLLTRPAVLAFFVWGMALCIRGGLRRKKNSAPRQGGRSFVETALWVIGACVTLASFIAAQAPVTGNDALAYHLYFPKLYVGEGRIFFDPTHARSLWPAMMSMLFTAGILLQGTALATLFSWLTAFLAAAAVPAAALYFWRDRAAAGFAALFMLTVPAVWMQSIYPYADNAMMLYGFLSFVALWLWRQSGYGGRAALLAGLCLAALLSIKYYTLILFFLLLLPYAYFIVSDKGASAVKKTKGALALLGAAFVFSAFWFIRSWVLTGNPVYPFLARVFDGHGYTQRMIGTALYPKTLFYFLVTPWNLFMKADIYGSEPLGVLFLAALPFLFFLRRADGLLKAAIFFLAAYCVAWFYTMQQARFFLPAVPFLSLVLAMGAGRWWAGEFFLKKASAALLAVATALTLALCLYYPALHLKAALGLTPADAFLSARERSYNFMKTLGPYLDKNAKALVVLEPRVFYVPAKLVYLSPALALYYEGRGLSFDAWTREAGITHVITMRRADLQPVPKHFLKDDQVLDATAVKETASTVSVDGDTFFYTLWRLDRTRPQKTAVRELL